MYFQAVFIGLIIGFTLYGIYFTIENRKEQELLQHSNTPQTPLLTPTAQVEGDLKAIAISKHSENASEIPATRSSIQNLPEATRSNSTALKSISPHNIVLVPLPEASASEKPRRKTEEETILTPSTPLAIRQACMKMLRKHQVMPGSSWGSLTASLQQRWTSLNCDKHVRHKVSIEHSEEPVTNVEQSGDISIPKLLHTQGLPNIPEEQLKWCISMKIKFHVQPMKTWGQLSPQLIEEWKKTRCDIIFTMQRMARKSVTNCTAHSKASKALPMIAIMAASTTRRMESPSPSNMALFTYLLPSLMRTLDCGYRYEYYLGYDEGDEYYDNDQGMKEVIKWIEKNVIAHLAKNNISFKFKPVRVHNTIKKPGPVFIEMARAAYRCGAAYFFRVNDDTEILRAWPKAFVRTLESLGSPYGVVGPFCSQGNDRILTHDFVHRVHMDIFEMNYYPPELTDWWMDDWISFVYGQTRSFKAKHIPVIHHTGAHGQRYQVDKSHELLLDNLLKQGSKQIRQYMLKANVNTSILQKFDGDRFELHFVHRDIPLQVKSYLHE